MTVCGKSNENNSNMNAQSRNLVANRPSFMITDILSKAAVEKAPTTAQNTEYLQHLERFSAMNHHAFGMMMPGQMPTAERKDTSFCDSDDDDFHGSDDVDGQSTDGSNHDKDELNESNRSGLPSDRMSHKKQRKARTAFTDHQLHSMEKCFSRQKYLSVQDRMELANKLGISDTQVKTWFQNRRTKWKRQTAVGLELFVEAGNYAAYQRAYAARYGQMDGLPSYPTNPLMMPGAGHPLGLPPSNLSSVESYYQQMLQNGMNGIASQHASMFAAPHRPLAMVPQLPGTGFLPLSPPNSLYATSRLPSTSPPQRLSPEQPRPNSLSPVASSLPSQSPKTSQPWPKQPTSTTHNVSDDESDIEV